MADRGYFDSEQILACEEAGITVTLHKPMISGNKAKGRFVKADFRYLADEDVYICPAGERLKFYYTNQEKGLTLRRYWTNACRTCAGYNVQAAVDSEHHLIVTHEVTNVGHDRSQLSPMAKQTKATLEVDKLDVVADRGYFNSEQILACAEAGITVTPAQADDIRQQTSRLTFAIWPMKMSTSAQPGSVSNTTTPTRKRGCGYVAMPDLHDQAALHHERSTTYHAMGTRACSGGRSAPAGRESASHASAPRDGRASLWHDQGADGRTTFYRRVKIQL